MTLLIEKGIDNLRINKNSELEGIVKLDYTPSGKLKNSWFRVNGYSGESISQLNNCIIKYICNTLINDQLSNITKIIDMSRETGYKKSIVKYSNTDNYYIELFVFPITENIDVIEVYIMFYK